MFILTNIWNIIIKIISADKLMPVSSALEFKWFPNMVGCYNLIHTFAGGECKDDDVPDKEFLVLVRLRRVLFF